MLKVDDLVKPKTNAAKRYGFKKSDGLKIVLIRPELTSVEIQMGRVGPMFQVENLGIWFDMSYFTQGILQLLPKFQQQMNHGYISLPPGFRVSK